MVTLGGRARIRDVVAIADAEPVVVDPAAISAVAHAHGFAAGIAGRVPIYGRSTGVGANRLTDVAGEDDHGMRLLRSHAVDAGGRLPDRTVRAMLAVRLNQLCVPGSGIDPEILTALEHMLNEDALPVVLEYASIGTGDLGALAGTALTLIGERPATRPLPAMPGWGADSALPFISSNALTIGRACLATQAALELASSMVYALSFLALEGNAEAFSELAARASATDSVIGIAARVRGALSGADAVSRPAARIQDPFGLRVYTLTEGPLAESIATLEEKLTRLVNTAQENPLFDISAFDHSAADTSGPAFTSEPAVVHHGAFFQAPLALALDATTLALAGTAPITHSRIGMMNEPAYTEQPPFLADGPAGSSGVMMLEYVAAGAIAELRASAQPASLGTLVLSRGVEEDASFASQGAVQLERAVAAYRVLLACELVSAVRLLRRREVGGQWRGVLGSALSIVEALPIETADRDLRPDIAAASTMLDGLGRLVGP